MSMLMAFCLGFGILLICGFVWVAVVRQRTHDHYVMSSQGRGMPVLDYPVMETDRLPLPTSTGLWCSCCGVADDVMEVGAVDVRVVDRSVRTVLCDVCIDNGVIEFAQNMAVSIMCAPRAGGLTADELDKGWP